LFRVKKSIFHDINVYLIFTVKINAKCTQFTFKILFIKFPDLYLILPYPTIKIFNLTKGLFANDTWMMLGAVWHSLENFMRMKKFQFLDGRHLWKTHKHIPNSEAIKQPDILNLTFSFVFEDVNVLIKVLISIIKCKKVSNNLNIC